MRPFTFSPRRNAVESRVLSSSFGREEHGTIKNPASVGAGVTGPMRLGLRDIPLISPCRPGGRYGAVAAERGGRVFPGLRWEATALENARRWGLIGRLWEAGRPHRAAAPRAFPFFPASGPARQGRDRRPPKGTRRRNPDIVRGATPRRERRSRRPFVRCRGIELCDAEPPCCRSNGPPIVENPMAIAQKTTKRRRNGCETVTLTRSTDGRVVPRRPRAL